MKETENVSIETQAAKSAKENKVPLSGGDRHWDCWLGFRSANPVLCIVTRSHVRTGLKLWRREKEFVSTFCLSVDRGYRRISLFQLKIYLSWFLPFPSIFHEFQVCFRGFFKIEGFHMGWTCLASVSRGI